MFDFLSWGHVLVIVLAALFIFGPERLPTLAQDAARGVKWLRGAVDATRDQFADALGEDVGELRNMDLRRYHPRTFLREQLLGDDSDGGLVPAAVPPGDQVVGGLRSHGTRRGGLPPFDPDAT